jgi:hypothetical protein
MIIIQEIKLRLCEFFFSVFQTLFYPKMLDWKHRGVPKAKISWKNEQKIKFAASSCGLSSTETKNKSSDFVGL